MKRFSPYLHPLYPYLRRVKRNHVLVGALVVTVGMLAVHAFSGDDPDAGFRVERHWFYDLNTGELFDMDRGAVAPIDAPSGETPEGQPAGVMAHVYGCGDCSETFVAVLETNAPQTRAALLNSATIAPHELRKAVVLGTLLKSPEGGDWVRARSAAGVQLRAQAVRRCQDQGKSPKPCYPD